MKNKRRKAELITAEQREKIKGLRSFFSADAYQAIWNNKDLTKDQAEMLIKIAGDKHLKNSQRVGHLPLTPTITSDILSTRVLQRVLKKQVTGFINFRKISENWQIGICELCRRNKEQKLIRTPLLHRKMVYTFFFICRRCRHGYYLKIACIYCAYVSIAILSSLAVGVGFGIVSKFFNIKK